MKQNNKFNVNNYLSKSDLEKISDIRIGIAGAGGLGSNCAVNLVRCGFTRFTIVDFDVVSESNLNRQFYFHDQVGLIKVNALKQNLERINPYVKINAIESKIHEKNIETIFGLCNVVIDGFDTPEYKSLLVEKFSHSNKFIVSASGIAGFGNSDLIKIKKIKKSLYMVGDGVSGIENGLPPLSPGIQIAAAKQADLVLEYALKGFKDE